MVYGFPQTKFFETFVALAVQKGLSPSVAAERCQDILNDRVGGRSFVPADGARVFFASQGGRSISPYEYHDFSSLLPFLRGTAKQGT